MDRDGYRPRIIDNIIKEYLDSFGAVCIEGPKWCGKTWTAAFHSKSAIYLGDPAGNFQNRRLAEMDPSLILDGEAPRLIDEWQEVPPVWDAVRYKVDMDQHKGRFILTGSATPNHKGILHSGAGRIARLRMRTMSLFESGDSSGRISLRDLCRGEIEPAITGEVELKHLAELIIRGGWPGSIGSSARQASLICGEYLRAIIEDDVYRLDGIKRDTIKMNLLLRSMARNESTTASNSTLIRDIRAAEADDIDSNTVSEYLDIFKRLYITEDQPPFATNVRSSVRVKQAPKRHFSDPSLAAYILGSTPESLLGDLETMGFLFEALCERDLRIYADSFGGRLYHYQDYKNQEIDAVIELPDGSWTALEIKLGANQIDKAAASLLRIKDQFEADGGDRGPSALCVICGLASAAYKREDGVLVVPITALKN